MTTRLKIADTAKEIHDVYWLRHEVYIVEDNKFGGEPRKDSILIDKFDALPGVSHVIVYDGDEPVGTMRINQDGVFGLPSEEYFDFTSFRESIRQESCKSVLTGGGMLAIRKKWRNRRDVIFAIFKMVTGVMMKLGTTHMLVTVNHETVSLYGRLGFKPLYDKIWIEDVGNFIVPMAAPYESIHRWVFGGIHVENFWLSVFSDAFERVLMGPNEKIFSEGDDPNHAYIIDHGNIKVTRTGPDGQDLTLANLPEGEIFGELALIDFSPRSASAITTTNVELITLSYAKFQQALNNKPELALLLLKHLARRQRESNDMMMVMAFAPQTGRVMFALKSLHSQAKPDPKKPGYLISHMSPSELAKFAGVRESEVRHVLESERINGKLDYSDHIIRFPDNATGHLITE